MPTQYEHCNNCYVLILTALNKAIEFDGKNQVLGIPEKDLKLKPDLINYK